MSRPLLIRSTTDGYHITARSNNKDWYCLPLGQVWNIYRDVIYRTIDRYQIHLHAFVLMGNHFHGIISTPKDPVDIAMRYFMTESSRAIARASNRINHVYGGRHKATFLGDAFSYAYVLKYVLRNPVRAGVVASVSEYRWSTWSKHLDLSEIPVVDRFDRIAQYVPKCAEERTEWLNLPTPKEQEELIRLGLRKFKFEFTKYRDHQKTLEALRESYGIPDDAPRKDDEHL